MLTNYERETIITFNKAEKTANIFTYDKAWQRHLENKLGLVPLYNNGCGGREYEIDKKRIKPPRAVRKLSKSQKAKLVENLARNRHLSSEKPNKLAKTKREKGK